MSTFGGLILTNRGRNLQSKAQAGITLQYTRIGVGDGHLGSTSILDLNNLVNEVMSLDITKLKVLGDGRAVIGTVLSNQNMTEGFYFREIGLFAEDPDLGEVLYCYGNAGELAEYISAGGGTDIIEKSIDIQTIVGNAENISAVINESLVYATKEDLENIEIPVTSVNNKTGDVKLTAEDVGAETPDGAQAKVNALAGEGNTKTVKDLDEEIAAHKADYIHHAGYGTASGTNAKTITLNPAPITYKEGMTIAFKNATQNTGAVTINVNNLGAKPVLKSNGNALTSGNLKANSVYTVRYNGSNFILQGEGGEYGTAQAQDVLEGKTIGTEEGLVTGAMPNNGAINRTITTQGGQITIPPGYTEGGSVKALLTNLTPEVLKAGVNVGGIVGNYSLLKHLSRITTFTSETRDLPISRGVVKQTHIYTRNYKRPILAIAACSYGMSIAMFDSSGAKIDFRDDLDDGYSIRLESYSSNQLKIGSYSSTIIEDIPSVDIYIYS